MITLRAKSPASLVPHVAPLVAGDAVSAVPTAEFHPHPSHRFAIAPHAPAASAPVRVALRNFYLRHTTC